MLDTAVCGLGWWGKQVAQVLRGNAKINIVCGVDPMQETREAWAKQTGLPTHDSYEKALADPKVKAVILTTPHSLHEQQVLAAAAAGKQIFCEKPLSLTAASARRMIEACRTKGLVMGLGHERRWEPAMLRLREIVAAGELGEILHVEANMSHDKFAPLTADNWRGSKKDAPAAGWTGMGVHLSDMMISLIGPVVEVHSYSAKRVLPLPSGDVISVHLRFADQTTGHIAAVSATPFFARFAVWGSKGWVEIRETEHVETPAATHFYRRMTGQKETHELIQPGDPVRANFEAWVDAVEGRGTYPFTDVHRMANVAVLEALVRSVDSGRPEKVEQL